MSNSEPSAIVLHGIPCIGGLYISFDSNGEIGSLKVRRYSSAPPSSPGILSPSLLALLDHFAQIHDRPYLNRSKSILKAWLL